MASSSTIASILKMAVVFVATNPRILNRLVKDLDDADEKGLLSPIPHHKVLLFQIPGLTRDLLIVTEGDECPSLPHGNYKRNASTVRHAGPFIDRGN